MRHDTKYFNAFTINSEHFRTLFIPGILLYLNSTNFQGPKIKLKLKRTLSVKP